MKRAARQLTGKVVADAGSDRPPHVEVDGAGGGARLERRCDLCWSAGV